MEVFMNNTPSRRNFLAAGLALPAVASASRSSGSGQSQPQPPARLSSGAALQYRTLGKTGLRVTTVGYGCMITSDPTVITRAVDMGINYFDTSRNYQGGQNERMVGAALGAKRKDIFLGEQMRYPDGIGHPGGTRHQPQGTQHRPPGRLAPSRLRRPGADFR